MAKSKKYTQPIARPNTRSQKNKIDSIVKKPLQMKLKLHRIPDSVLKSYMNKSESTSEHNVTKMAAPIAEKMQLRPRKVTKAPGKVEKKRQPKPQNMSRPVKIENSRVKPYQKERYFRLNALVFAKVKGYRTWPAVIFGQRGKKYDVTFYGTGETAAVEFTDLHKYCEETHELLGVISQSNSKFARAFRSAIFAIKEAFEKANSK